MRKIVFALVLLLVLVGCGAKEGRVLDKRWKPDLSYWGTQTSCSIINGKSRCTTSPHWHYNPPEYYLILEVPGGDVKDKRVNKKVYYKTNVGDYYREK